MANIDLTIEEKMAALRQSYAQQLDGKIAEIFKHVVAITPDETDDVILEHISSVRALTHKLAGSGATFGFKEVSIAARKMEDACIKMIDDKKINVDIAEILKDGIKDLEKSSIQPDIRMEKPRATEGVEKEGSVNDREIRKVIVLDSNTKIREQIVNELTHFGFLTIGVSHPNEIAATVGNDKPFALISDIVFNNDEDIAFKTISDLRKSGVLDCPIIIHSAIDDMRHRLGAVRAGARNYLVKPVDMADMIDVLDSVAPDVGADPFRVLVIDDDASLSHHTELVLQGAGMTTKALNDPMGVIGVLNDFAPELILLDLYMPDCEGHEVAAIIRQQEAFDAIPIVFLSGEHNVEKQLSAMELGGDDFLTKPIQPKHLITAVRIRAARFRELRSLMVRDSMTGLYNHTTTKQLMTNEIERAKRLNHSISMASLDIDHFKSVNDTYGHAVGDKVIKSLARLLRQRLRGADIIGRMGGEEFAALLSGATIEEAEIVFNQIRQAFSEIVFHTDIKDFSVTLSCGIAEFPAFNGVSSLSDASDRALYEAKHGGRNKVVLAK